ncbi:MAG TPA: ubiquinol-cytochrome c reductase iron-sulfur subunit [Bryobacteraceae bacterium]|nr:ubiquinol-cytochrome c reductase iron-sulfur subunit [Bryobacteraceae bacterium]
MQQVAEAAPQTTRRRFYLTFIYGLWGAISAALAAPAFIYLFLPPKMRRESDWVEAGDVSKLQLKNPVEMVFRKNAVDGWKVSSEQQTAWVVKLSDQQIVAFGPQCTHLGCAYHWEERSSEFLCPCHSSVFSVDGKVVSGPAPRPLDRYDTKIENGKLLLGALRESRSLKS